MTYGTPVAFFVLAYAAKRYWTQQQNFRVKQDNLAAGLDQPPSLHPIIDEQRCIGCGTCVAACPESNVLGLIEGKAELISPANCIGHGACKQACPIDAISLVFGTAERGVELPEVSPSFETTVPGVYVAGELGGMGLVSNAIEQGVQAIDAIALRPAECSRNSSALDVVIVGAGPAGIAAALAAKEKNLNYLVLEQDSLGGTVYHFPRNKIVMTRPAKLPLIGKMKFTETRKEALLEYWQSIVTQQALEIRSNERVERVEKREQEFEVSTDSGCYQSYTVLLCLGRRGTPRMLGIPGEEQAKVTYSLRDASQYRNRKVLVVGGGDSALEAAMDLAENAVGSVHLMYRGDAFSRAKPKNRERLRLAQISGQLTVLMNSSLVRIEQSSVMFESGDELHELENDDLIVCAGGIMPTQFLRDIGISIETKYGTV